MKKEYIKPIIIIIKTYNDDALLQTASLYDYNKVDSVENIAGEDDKPIPIRDDHDIIWND
nr:hypothetical protein [uncultured Prevotella sp.]